ncbi:peptidyl-alpha-hydroxyglycine alpha-amidating lyase family protein [Paraburkholderia sp. PREW-6R]|uniref:peptidyl-alpha-hydroxyglycine alpha-amidating lyase family protein n=1 Tax=Paraburkholderia sp. PREW-6R TaxID=3141544 RepID=UPI0031F5AE01
MNAREPVMGANDYTYVAHDWGQLPDGWRCGDVGGVAVDRHDNVYVFNRSEHPMLVFDRDGRFLRSWGEDQFVRPHGIHIGPDDAIYCTDDGAHTVKRFSSGGRLELTIGTPQEGAPFMSGRPFNRCTHTALSPDGDIYVTDGYGNARVHKFSAHGKLLASWGGPGIEPGQFNIPHNLCCDANGWVYVADRENHRVQVFDADGRFETQWHSLHRPCAFCMSGTADARFYVGEVGPGLPINRLVPNLGPRITVLDASGTILARIGTEGAGLGLSQFIAPHGMAVDSHGDIYVGEVSHAAWPEVFPGEPLPEQLRTLRKLVRAPADAASGGSHD